MILRQLIHIERAALPKNSRYFLPALLAALGIALFWFFLRPLKTPPVQPVQSSDVCAGKVFEGVSYIVCAVDSAKYDIRLSRLQTDGTPYRSLARLLETAKGGGMPFIFAMNAGMYHEDLSPVGLYVEEGKEQAMLQSGEGEGNFFLKPNGVFFVTAAGKAGVLTTEDYAAEKPAAWFATQSGPMLVINGAPHPKFEENGASRFIRNGVGLRADGTAVFAISRTEVSFGSFARLFRDALECPNALYFDGVVSAFSDGDSTLVGGGYPAGPIILVRKKEAAATQ